MVPGSVCQQQRDGGASRDGRANLHLLGRPGLRGGSGKRLTTCGFAPDNPLTLVQLPDH